MLTKPDRERGERDHCGPSSCREARRSSSRSPRHGGIDNAQIAVLDLRTGKSKVLLRAAATRTTCRRGIWSTASAGRCAPSVRPRTAGSGRDAAPVLEGVVTTYFGAADVAVAANGSLVYVPGSAAGEGRQTVVSVDRQGRAIAAARSSAGLATAMSECRPTGTRLALATQDDVWIYDVARATRSRLTTDPALDTSPLWTPDGQRIIFTSTGRATRSCSARRGWHRRDELFLARAKDFSICAPAAGRQTARSSCSPRSCRQRRARSDRSPSGARPTSAAGEHRLQRPGRPSPNGRLDRLRIRTCPVNPRFTSSGIRSLADRQPISSGGGRLPVWSHDGRELFFSSRTAGRCLQCRCSPGRRSVAGPSASVVRLPDARPMAGLGRTTSHPTDDSSSSMIWRSTATSRRRT